MKLATCFTEVTSEVRGKQTKSGEPTFIPDARTKNKPNIYMVSTTLMGIIGRTEDKMLCLFTRLVFICLLI